MDDDRRRHRQRRRRIINERILLVINLVNNNDPSVTEISLRGIETENQIRALFQGMQQNTRVRKLDLLNTPRELQRAVCQQLLPLLLRENSSIEVLGFPIKMTNAEFEFAAEILCNSNSNTAVTTLSLDGCDIRGTEGGQIIARLIRNNNHRITTINLYRNLNLGPAGALCIATALGDDDCALKTLSLGRCGIGDEGVNALCTALQVNNSLETFWFGGNKIADEGCRALAKSLPRMSELQEIGFDWEPQVSATLVQQMMEGLLANRSLQLMVAYGGNLSEEQKRQWDTCCAFVCARNKMNRRLDEVEHRTLVAAREGRVAPIPVPMGHLLQWCHRPLQYSFQHSEDSEVQNSLVYLALRSHADKLQYNSGRKRKS